MWAEPWKGKHPAWEHLEKGILGEGRQVHRLLGETACTLVLLKQMTDDPRGQEAGWEPDAEAWSSVRGKSWGFLQAEGALSEMCFEGASPAACGPGVQAEVGLE